MSERLGCVHLLAIHTDMKVAGKNIIVRRVIDFMTALSELASML